MPNRSALAAACGLILCTACGSAGSSTQDWADWSAFTGRFLQEDGRIVDLTFEQKSTSEGQSYGLFLALVANDRKSFESILRWSSLNLAHAELGKRLPAWHWGKKEDGSWGIKDPNPASDADLFFAYALLEAARLWKEPSYEQLGRRILKLVAETEIAQAGEGGTQLLPGPMGFDLGEGRYRIDPSYLPNFMFRYLATVDPKGPWLAAWNGYVQTWPTIFAKGIAPNLYVVDQVGRVWPDSVTTHVGSYDAIRVYLWAGMSGADGARMLHQLKPFAELIRQRGTPPEKVDPLTGRVLSGDWSPLGFSGAVLPYLKALGEQELLAQQLRVLRVGRAKAKLAGNANYYDEVLILFGLGWLEGRYRFDEQGRLLPQWEQRSTAP
ncbi:MAG TPA: cellulose synthase complex periplasmic endoglucanase BcsZ [Prosthecobacter sp.]